MKKLNNNRNEDQQKQFLQSQYNKANIMQVQLLEEHDKEKKQELIKEFSHHKNFMLYYTASQADTIGLKLLQQLMNDGQYDPSDLYIRHQVSQGAQPPLSKVFQENVFKRFGIQRTRQQAEDYRILAYSGVQPFILPMRLFPNQSLLVPKFNGIQLDFTDQHKPSRILTYKEGGTDEKQIQYINDGYKQGLLPKTQVEFYQNVAQQNKLRQGSMDGQVDRFEKIVKMQNFVQQSIKNVSIQQINKVFNIKKFSNDVFTAQSVGKQELYQILFKKMIDTFPVTANKNFIIGDLQKILNYDDTNKTFGINGTSKAGLAFGTLYQAEVREQIIAVVQFLYFALSDDERLKREMLITPFILKYIKYEDFVFNAYSKWTQIQKQKVFDWVNLTNLFPKMDILEVTSTVRNINGASAGATSIAQFIIQLLQYRSDILLNEPGFINSPNFAKGNANVAAETIRKQFELVKIDKQKKFLYVFSDNLFAVVNIHGIPCWLSLDGVSMEGSISREFAKTFFLSIIMKSLGYNTNVQCEGQTNSQNGVLILQSQGFGILQSAMLNYLKDIFAMSHCDLTTTFGSTQLQQFALGSGVAGTFILNSGKMFLVKTFLDQCDLDQLFIFDDQQQVIFAPSGSEIISAVTGVQLKIVRTFTNLQLQVWDLDFLGHSFVTQPGTDEYKIAILQQDRIAAAHLFDKGKDNRDRVKKQIRESKFKIEGLDQIQVAKMFEFILIKMKLYQLYTWGGWFYFSNIFITSFVQLATAEVKREQIQKLMIYPNFIKKMNELINTEMDYPSETEHFNESTIKFLLRIQPPTISEVIELMANKQQQKAFITWFDTQLSLGTVTDRFRILNVVLNKQEDQINSEVVKNFVHEYQINKTPEEVLMDIQQESIEQQQINKLKSQVNPKVKQEFEQDILTPAEFLDKIRTFKDKRNMNLSMNQLNQQKASAWIRDKSIFINSFQNAKQKSPVEVPFYHYQAILQKHYKSYQIPNQSVLQYLLVAVAREVAVQVSNLDFKNMTSYDFQNGPRIQSLWNQLLDDTKTFDINKILSVQPGDNDRELSQLVVGFLQLEFKFQPKKSVKKEIKFLHLGQNTVVKVENTLPVYMLIYYAYIKFTIFTAQTIPRFPPYFPKFKVNWQEKETIINLDPMAIIRVAKAMYEFNNRFIENKDLPDILKMINEVVVVNIIDNEYGIGIQTHFTNYFFKSKNVLRQHFDEVNMLVQMSHQEQPTIHEEEKFLQQVLVIFRDNLQFKLEFIYYNLGSDISKKVYLILGSLIVRFPKDDDVSKIVYQIANLIYNNVMQNSFLQSNLQKAATLLNSLYKRVDFQDQNEKYTISAICKLAQKEFFDLKQIQRVRKIMPLTEIQQSPYKCVRKCKFNYVPKSNSSQESTNLQEQGVEYLLTLLRLQGSNTINDSQVIVKLFIQKAFPKSNIFTLIPAFYYLLIQINQYTNDLFIDFILHMDQNKESQDPRVFFKLVKVFFDEQFEDVDASSIIIYKIVQQQMEVMETIQDFDQQQNQQVSFQDSDFQINFLYQEFNLDIQDIFYVQQQLLQIYTPQNLSSVWMSENFRQIVQDLIQQAINDRLDLDKFAQEEAIIKQNRMQIEINNDEVYQNSIKQRISQVKKQQLDDRTMTRQQYIDITNQQDKNQDQDQSTNTIKLTSQNLNQQFQERVATENEKELRKITKQKNKSGYGKLQQKGEKNKQKTIQKEIQKSDIQQKQIQIMKKKAKNLLKLEQQQQNINSAKLPVTKDQMIKVSKMQDKDKKYQEKLLLNDQKQTQQKHDYYKELQQQTQQTMHEPIKNIVQELVQNEVEQYKQQIPIPVNRVLTTYIPKQIENQILKIEDQSYQLVNYKEKELLQQINVKMQQENSILEQQQQDETYQRLVQWYMNQIEINLKLQKQVNLMLDINNPIVKRNVGFEVKKQQTELEPFDIDDSTWQIRSKVMQEDFRSFFSDRDYRMQQQQLTQKKLELLPNSLLLQLYTHMVNKKTWDDFDWLCAKCILSRYFITHQQLFYDKLQYINQVNSRGQIIQMMTDKTVFEPEDFQEFLCNQEELLSRVDEAVNLLTQQY